MAPTIKQIAKLANVSIATVSRALTNDEKVKSETKELVLKAAKELNYKPNIIARNFVKGKSNIVGLILPDISDEFFSEIIRGVDETSYDHGYYTMVISSHKNRSLVESVHTLMSNGLVGGFIVLVPLMDEKIKEALMSERVPFVVIGGDDGVNEFDAVTTNNYQAAFNMVEFLVGKGYKKIAHISGPTDNNDALKRRKGFLDACSKFSLEIKENWIIDGDFTMEGGAKAADKILNESEKPQVIFAANDMMALGCFKAIQSKGLIIPADIGVVGFDDILISEYANPALTTVRVNTDRIGKQAAERLIEKINGVECILNRKIEIESQLVVRNSC
ncbi:MAG: LacI family transcriptional regulator [Bacteroidetes bacterium]|nr:LacI family transcriptional regulator [Bacteroidota bacterium]